MLQYPNYLLSSYFIHHSRDWYLILPATQLDLTLVSPRDARLFVIRSTQASYRFNMFNYLYRTDLYAQESRDTGRV